MKIATGINLNWGPHIFEIDGEEFDWLHLYQASLGEEDNEDLDFNGDEHSPKVKAFLRNLFSEHGVTHVMDKEESDDLLSVEGYINLHP